MVSRKGRRLISASSWPDRRATDDDWYLPPKKRTLQRLAGVNDQIVAIVTDALPNRLSGARRQLDEICQPHGMILPMLLAPVCVLGHPFGGKVRLE